MLLTNEEYNEEKIRWKNRLVKNCKKCGGTGYIDNLIANYCYACECSLNTELFSLLVKNGVPRKYVDWEWKHCEDNDFVDKCKYYAEHFEENYLDGKGIFLNGLQGRGKTTMESLISKEVIKKINQDNMKHFSIKFVLFEELIQMSLNGIKDYSYKLKLEDIINHSDLLIIDNIGSETGFGNDSKHNVKLLETIIRKRDNNCLPLLMSSNFDINEMRQKYSDTIASFIEQNCDIINVDGLNFRKKQDDQFGWGE